MKTQKEILAEIIDLDKELIDFYWHSSDFITPYQACKAMQQYAEEYHRNEINKLNKSDVISSVCEHDLKFRWMSDGSKLCEECGEEF